MDLAMTLFEDGTAKDNAGAVIGGAAGLVAATAQGAGVETSSSAVKHT